MRVFFFLVPSQVQKKQQENRTESKCKQELFFIHLLVCIEHVQFMELSVKYVHLYEFE